MSTAAVAVENQSVARSVALAANAASTGADANSATKSAPETFEQAFGKKDQRERFIPVTRQALMERLMRPQYWHAGDAVAVRRFFRFLDYWRQQSYSARLAMLERVYEPFSPDSDLLITRKYSAEEQKDMQHRLVTSVEELMTQANYTRVDPKHVDLIMTKDSHYGLDLHVDLSAFEILSIYYRGASSKKEERRSIKQLYLRKQEFDVPIFQRMCIMFKLKPSEVHIAELVRDTKCSREEAEKSVKRLRSALPPQVKSDFVYLKLFKNMPRSDIEMVFPNTKVKFRLFDKLKLGVTAGGGLGMGVVGTAGKIAVATNPIALAGAVAGLGGIAIRQGVNFMNQKNKYMVTMAQNLYFHAMADNRGVMTLLADRAADEDVKEEVLLYSVLAKETVHRRELPDVDRAIEQYLLNTFGVSVNFDVEDALKRLLHDGLVREMPDGTLRALPPAAAASHIDKLWDQYLDDLPDLLRDDGIEFDLEPDEDATAA